MRIFAHLSPPPYPSATCIDNSEDDYSEEESRDDVRRDQRKEKVRQSYRDRDQYEQDEKKRKHTPKMYVSSCDIPREDEE